MYMIYIYIHICNYDRRGHKFEKRDRRDMWRVSGAKKGVLPLLPLLLPSISHLGSQVLFLTKFILSIKTCELV